MKLSVIIPCYNEENNIDLFYQDTVRAFGNLIEDTELIFVNDGSSDRTMEKLRNLYKTSPYRIKILNFSRNFGKEAGIIAGLEAAKGDYISIVDADMQQRPKYIVEMLNILETQPDYDCVAAYPDKRAEGKVISAIKNSFYKLMNAMCDVEIRQSTSDFRTFKRRMADAIISLPESCRFSKGIFSWVGFETCYIPYEVEERAFGTTKWSFLGLFRYALDGIAAFSTKPLIIASILGTLICIIAFISAVVVIIKTMLFGDPVAGYPTLICVLLFGTGIQLLCMGILGQYLSKTYIETKHRPLYVMKEVLSKEEEQKDEMGE
ncbi:MAG: glycosyltransferase family 2 protein [Hespellia sp.]|nr:glycosyltransferase family 2 protein [Hespellia sp.]